MTRTFNFSAGPAGLPTQVLQQAQAELLDWQGLGCSVMEISHRDRRVVAMFEAAEAKVRALLSVPEDHAVLFLQGGATAMFDLIPANLAPRRIHVLNTGAWSEKAIAAAEKVAQVQVTGQAPYTQVPDLPEIGDVDYFHYCHNETIHGVRVAEAPDLSVPVVCDASSSVFSEAIDWSRHDLVYAGAQKNLGPSGVTLVIGRRSLFSDSVSVSPVFDFSKQAKAGSMVNTPPVYGVYLIDKVLDWIDASGGVQAMQRRAVQRSDALYQAIDQSSFYTNPVQADCRSRMNIPFLLADSALDQAFVSQAESRGLMFLKGHRSVGGMRASLYNAIQDGAVEALIDYMREFEAQHA